MKITNGLCFSRYTQPSKKDKILKCQTCDFRTIHNSGLRHHLLVHERRGERVTYNCKQCSFQLTSRADLRLHMNEHKRINKSLQKCVHCDFQAKNNDTLKKHLLKHKDFDEVETFQCYKCSFKTKYKSALNRHLIGTTNHPSDFIVYRCADCPYTSKILAELKQHRSSKHKDVDDKQLFCTMCSFSTMFQASLTKHIDTLHNGPINSELKLSDKFICSECGFETTQKHYLNRHKKVHHSVEEIKIFKCDICPFQTKYKAGLKYHSISHKKLDEITPYKCTKCDFRTKTSYYLSRHMPRHMEAQEPLKCQQCEFKTKTLNQLKIHIKRIHEGDSSDGPFKCSQCSFETMTKTCLKSHVKMHKNMMTKIFQCPLCSVKSRSNYYLMRKHMQKHHPSEAHKYEKEQAPLAILSDKNGKHEKTHENYDSSTIS